MGVSNDVVTIDVDGLLFFIRLLSFVSKKKSCGSRSSCTVVGIACGVVNGRRDGLLLKFSRSPIVVCSFSSSGIRVDFSACGRCLWTLLSRIIMQFNSGGKISDEMKMKME